eukprot:5973341-Pleurochrysis_carterae.AAC.1
MYCNKEFHEQCKHYTGNGLYNWQDVDDEVDLKVVDHSHYTGRYRGPAHRSCNLKVKLASSKIPVVFHNLNYDLKCILQSFTEISKDSDELS